MATIMRSVFVALIGLVVCSGCSRKELDSRMPSSRNRLRVLGLVFHNYQQKHGELPPPIKRFDDGIEHSWRVVVSPLLHGVVIDEEYEQIISRPWDAEENATYHRRVPSEFLSREAFVAQGHLPYEDIRKTNILAVTDEAGNWARPTVTVRGHPEYPEPQVLLAVAVTSLDDFVIWMEPKDITWQEVKARLEKDRSTISHVLFEGGYVFPAEDVVIP